jgi:hypothetical protein
MGTSNLSNRQLQRKQLTECKQLIDRISKTRFEQILLRFPAGKNEFRRTPSSLERQTTEYGHFFPSDLTPKPSVSAPHSRHTPCNQGIFIFNHAHGTLS